MPPLTAAGQLVCFCFCVTVLTFINQKAKAEKIIMEHLALLFRIMSCLLVCCLLSLGLDKSLLELNDYLALEYST